jgi:electron transport complex protein RnfG
VSPSGAGRLREVVTIAASMTVTSAVGAALLGGVYLGTARYQEIAEREGERRAVTEMLSLDSTAAVSEVRQFLAPERGEVVYRTAAEGGAARELVFRLDGTLVSQGAAVAGEEAGAESLEPLGRMFVATRAGRPAGFVVEGESRGYKNLIRFFVAIDSSFDIAAVRVVEHEEDPGLGAEAATRWFQGQYVGRPAAGLGSLDVTRDPMPEDWRAALAKLDRTPVAEWRAQQKPLLERERSKPIYAVTGATISSRALTDGVRTTVDHFRRRWELIAPHLGGAPSQAAVPAAAETGGPS